MDIRPGCDYPMQPTNTVEDEQHPRYAEYRQWRNAMTRQLVQANSFRNWLAQTEASEQAARNVAHPRHGDYCAWLREKVNCTNPTSSYKPFHEWLNS